MTRHQLVELLVPLIWLGLFGVFWWVLPRDYGSARFWKWAVRLLAVVAVLLWVVAAGLRAYPSAQGAAILTGIMCGVWAGVFNIYRDH
ncbi:MAG: hypothetical protein ACLQM8_09465 [Limisphaerales bacterium]